MPIPIMPVNHSPLGDNKNEVPTADYGIDVSALPFAIEKKSKSNNIIKVSNFEAGILFKLWKDAESIDGDHIPTPDSISNNDILRLKASGLISGGMEDFTFTQRGKDVIKTIVLSEENSLDKNSKTKQFQEVLADKAKKASSGPRLALGRIPG